MSKRSEFATVFLMVQAFALGLALSVPVSGAARAGADNSVVGSTATLTDGEGRRLLGPDALSCMGLPDGTGVLLHVQGFKDRRGNIRVELFSDREDEFLTSRKKLIAQGALFRRVDVKLPEAGHAALVCMRLPRPGHYALVVLHDRNANGKFNFSADGVGFPNNPKLGLSKPDVEKCAFQARPGVTELPIVLNYSRGLLSVGPVRQPAAD